MSEFGQASFLIIRFPGPFFLIDTQVLAQSRGVWAKNLGPKDLHFLRRLTYPFLGALTKQPASSLKHFGTINWAITNFTDQLASGTSEGILAISVKVILRD